MPEFAQFKALPEDAFTLTRLYSKIFHFDLPDLDLTRTVILMFKVSGSSGVHLLMMNRDIVTAKEPKLIDFTLDSTFAAPRSWHEIVQVVDPSTQDRVIRAKDNQLIVLNAGESPSDSKVTVSDIVVLYHAKT